LDNNLISLSPFPHLDYIIRRKEDNRKIFKNLMFTLQNGKD